MSKDSDLDIKKRMQAIMPMLMSSFDPESEFNKWRRENPYLPEVMAINMVSERLDIYMGNFAKREWLTKLFFDEHAAMLYQECVNNIDVFEKCNEAFKARKSDVRPLSVTTQATMSSSMAQPIVDMWEIEANLSKINHASMLLSLIEKNAKMFIDNNLTTITDEKYKSYYDDLMKCMSQIRAIQESAPKLISDFEIKESYLFLSEELKNNTKNISELRTKIPIHCPSCPKDEVSSAVIRTANKHLKLFQDSSRKPKI